MPFVFEKRVISQRSVAADLDVVMAGCPVPTGGRLLKTATDFRIIGSPMQVDQVCFFGINGALLPVTDPNAGVIWDAHYDAMVPKDGAALVASAGQVTLDYDSTTADTNPEFQLGEPNWERMLQSGLTPAKTIQHRAMVSFADRDQKGFEAGTPDTFVPTASYQTVSRKGGRAKTPSMAYVAFSNPSTAKTTGTIDSSPATAARWHKIRYLLRTVESAYETLIGDVEAGAESPSLEAVNTIVDLMEQDLIEGTASAFAAQTYIVFCETVFTVEVPGIPQFKSLKDGD